MLRQAILCLLTLLSAWSPLWAEPRTVRVGLYQNSPKVAYSEAGKPEGIFVDLIEAIADKEGWTLDYVPGTWSEGLARLAAAQIDLMPDVALTTERQQVYAFHSEPVLSSWSQIYARRGSGIRSLLDLHGKRVAVLEDSIQQDFFTQMIAGFGLSASLVLHTDFAAAFSAVAQGQADAVVTNRFYGVRQAGAYGLEDTAIVFNPSRLYFAAPKSGYRLLLGTIDKHLVDFKRDSTSIYYRSLRRWSAEEVRLAVPPWLPGAALAAAALLLASAAWVILLRRQVAARTHEIRLRNDEMLAVNRTLRAATSRLKLSQVVDEAIRGALALTGFDGGVICIRDAERGLLRVGFANNGSAITEKASSGGPPFDAVGSAVEDVTRAGRTVLLQAGAWGTLLPFGNEGGASARWNAFFPLQVGDRQVGLLCLFSRHAEPPAQHRLDLVEEICAPVALAIENARLYEQAQQQAQELERRVVLRTDELARANRELLEAKKAAESADRLKSAFLATMSHELRTPLNSIIGFTGIVLQGLAGPLNGEQQKQLGMVRDSARHLLALINDVLDISKIEAGELAVGAEVFDLAASIGKVAAIVKTLADKKALVLSVNVAEGVGKMVGDARRVEQILLNLLGNAIKFTESGSVTLDATPVAGFKPEAAAAPCPAVRLRVTDTGIGIKPEDMALLFKPFRQVDSALSRGHEGTGLGLAICRRLAALMGGTIEADSRWQEGSVFTVTLPLHPQSVVELA